MASCRNITIQLYAGSLALHEALTDYRHPGQRVFLSGLRRIHINKDSAGILFSKPNAGGFALHEAALMSSIRLGWGLCSREEKGFVTVTLARCYLYCKVLVYRQ